jgi:hypothetical protein
VTLDRPIRARGRLNPKCASANHDERGPSHPSPAFNEEPTS